MANILKNTVKFYDDIVVFPQISKSTSLGWVIEYLLSNCDKQYESVVTKTI